MAELQLPKLIARVRFPSSALQGPPRLPELSRGAASAYDRHMPDLVPIPSPDQPLYFGEPSHPLVVVLHDWYGRLPWLEAYAGALASQGFRVVVPDLYKGWATTNAVDAEALMGDVEEIGRAHV